MYITLDTLVAMRDLRDDEAEEELMVAEGKKTSPIFRMFVKVATVRG